MKHEFTLRIEELKAALLFSGRDESRYVLCGVHVSLKTSHPILSATDGKVLIVIQSDGENAVPRDVGFIIGNLALEALEGIDQETFLDCTYEDEPGSSSLIIETVCGLTFQLSHRSTHTSGLIAGNFPNIAQVMPTGAPVAVQTIGVDPMLLCRFVDAKEILIGNRSGVRVRFNDCTGPLEISAEGLDNVYCLLMPMRIDGNITCRPSWLDVLRSAKTPAAKPAEPEAAA